MQVDKCSFGELWDMPMKKPENRTPCANPTCNKKVDCHVQPSRQVRKIKKYARIIKKMDIVVIFLYRFVLFD